MRIIYLLCLVSLFCFATAKYLRDDSESKDLRKNRRSIEEHSEQSNTDENSSNDSSDKDNDDDDNDLDGQNRKIIEKELEIQRKHEERQRKLEEKREKEERKLKERELKQQQKIQEEQLKLQHRLEEQQRKLQEKIAKDERKHQEKAEKEERKRQQLIAKEERKRQEKIQKDLEEIQKDVLESEKVIAVDDIVDISAESQETDLEDMWHNYVYTKYNLSASSTKLEKHAAVVKYLQEELQLNATSTKNEYQQAVLQLIQNRLLNDSTQDGFHNYVISHVNAVNIQKLRTEIENDIIGLENKTALLQNFNVVNITEAQQNIDQRKTILQSIAQFLSNTLPSWITGTQATSAPDTSVSGFPINNGGNTTATVSSADAFVAASNSDLSGAVTTGTDVSVVIPASSLPNDISGNANAWPAISGVAGADAETINNPSASESKPTSGDSASTSESSLSASGLGDVVPASSNLDVTSTDIESGTSLHVTETDVSSAAAVSTSAGSNSVSGNGVDTVPSSPVSDPLSSVQDSHVVNESAAPTPISNIDIPATAVGSITSSNAPVIDSTLIISDAVPSVSVSETLTETVPSATINEINTDSSVSGSSISNTPESILTGQSGSDANLIPVPIADGGSLAVSGADTSSVVAVASPSGSDSTVIDEASGSITTSEPSLSIDESVFVTATDESGISGTASGSTYVPPSIPIVADGSSVSVPQSNIIVGQSGDNTVSSSSGMDDSTSILGTNQSTNTGESSAPISINEFTPAASLPGSSETDPSVGTIIPGASQSDLSLSASNTSPSTQVYDTTSAVSGAAEPNTAPSSDSSSLASTSIDSANELSTSNSSVSVPQSSIIVGQSGDNTVSSSSGMDDSTSVLDTNESTNTGESSAPISINEVTPAASLSDSSESAPSVGTIIPGASQSDLSDLSASNTSPSAPVYDTTSAVSGATEPNTAPSSDSSSLASTSIDSASELSTSNSSPESSLTSSDPAVNIVSASNNTDASDVVLNIAESSTVSEPSNSTSVTEAQDTVPAAGSNLSESSVTASEPSGIGGVDASLTTINPIPSIAVLYELTSTESLAPTTTSSLVSSNQATTEISATDTNISGAAPTSANLPVISDVHSSATSVVSDGSVATSISEDLVVTNVNDASVPEPVSSVANLGSDSITDGVTDQPAIVITLDESSFSNTNASISTTVSIDDIITTTESLSINSGVDVSTRSDVVATTPSVVSASDLVVLSEEPNSSPTTETLNATESQNSIQNETSLDGAVTEISEIVSNTPVEVPTSTPSLIKPDTESVVDPAGEVSETSSVTNSPINNSVSTEQPAPIETNTLDTVAVGIETTIAPIQDSVNTPDVVYSVDGEPLNLASINETGASVLDAQIQ